LSDRPALRIAVRRDLWAAVAEPDRSLAAVRAAIEAFAEQLGCDRPAVAFTRDDADDAPPLRLVAASGARLPSVASWLRASAAALGRFPRVAEIQPSIAGGLLGAAGTPAVLAGLTELCLELLRADPAALGAWPPLAAAHDAANQIDLAIHDADIAALFGTTDPDALGSELARLVWETTGIPIALRISVDPARSRGSAGVRIAAIDECPIPVLLEGYVLTGARPSDDQVVPVAGNPLWLIRADRLEPGDARIEPAWALAACLLDLVRERAPRLLCRAALDDMYRLARASSPGTFTMAVQRLGRPRLDALIAELVRHATPISDMRCVCQAIAEFTPTAAAPGAVVLGNAAASADDDSAAALLSFVRIRVGARIVAMLSDGEAQLRAHLIDPAWAELAERDMSTGHGEVLRAAIRRASAIGYGGSRWRIVLVVKLAVRALVADLLRVEFPHVTVVAFEEIPAWVTLEPISQHVGATAR
jgi:hypothetical protein